MRHNYIETDVFTEDMPFGEYIRKKRRLMGYNQIDFAELIGINQGTLSQWELGITSPPIEVAKRIVSQFGGKVIIKAVD